MSYTWETRFSDENLGSRFIRISKKNWSRSFLSDSLIKSVSYGRALVGSFLLAQKIRKLVKKQDVMGVLLPPSVAGALVNFALALANRVCVNLNYTLGQEILDLSIAEAGIKTVITSRKVLEKLPFEFKVEVVFIEDLRSSITRFDKIIGFLACRFLPSSTLCSLFDVAQVTVHSTVVILFSSGTTGLPKGIMLSHHNILSNCEQIMEAMHFEKEKDIFMGCLPFFHAFGLTGTLWLPLLSQTAVVYHANPLEAEQVGRMIKHHKCSIFVSTPTLCQLYVKTIPPRDMNELKYWVVGAEKLTAAVRESVKEVFGMEILEGYGCTELSPVVSFNLPTSNCPGTVGRLLPGQELKFFDIEHPDQESQEPYGILAVKGPNVMQGYLNNHEMTRAVLRHGYYITGDVARLDEAGYLIIEDRISRFSKIGGEMVPHLKIEQVITDSLPGTEAFVCGVSDSKRGEILVLLYKDEAHLRSPQDIWAHLQKSDLPKLWIPKQSHIFEVEEIPVLMTGQINYSLAKLTASVFAKASMRS